MPSRGSAFPAARLAAAAAAALRAAWGRWRVARAGPWRSAAAGDGPLDGFAARLWRLGPERAPPGGAVPPGVPDAPGPAAADGGALPAVAASVAPALARAGAAAAYLRLALPAGAPAERDLALLEDALGELRRRVGALGAAGGPDGEVAVDLAHLVEDVLASLPARPRGPRFRRTLRRTIALAAPRRVRLALREALGALADAAPPGAELRVTVEARGREAVVELEGGLAGADDGAPALLRAVLGPRGGRVEEELLPARGRTLRVSFPLATRV